MAAPATSGPGPNYLYGGSNSDHLYGGPGITYIMAGGGNDFLYGQLNGTGILNAGAGRDNCSSGGGVYSLIGCEMLAP